MKAALILTACLFSFMSEAGVSSVLAPHKNNQANKLFGEKRYQEALDAYLELYEEDKENSELAYNIANTYSLMGDSQKAELFYEKALSAENAHTKSVSEFNAGLMELNNQKLESAVEHFVSYLKEHPDDQDAKRNLEIALKKLQQQEQQQQQDNKDKKDSEDQEKQDSQSDQNQDNQQEDQQNQDKQQKDQQNQDQQGQDQKEQDQEKQESGQQENQKDPSSDQQQDQQENQQQDSQEENQKKEQQESEQQQKEPQDQKKSQENQRQNGKTGEEQNQASQAEPSPMEEMPESERMKEQILNALKEQEAQQQKQFMRRKSSKGQRKSKDW